MAAWLQTSLCPLGVKGGEGIKVRAQTHKNSKLSWTEGSFTATKCTNLRKKNIVVFFFKWQNGTYL